MIGGNVPLFPSFQDSSLVFCCGGRAYESIMDALSLGCTGINVHCGCCDLVNWRSDTCSLPLTGEPHALSVQRAMSAILV